MAVHRRRVFAPSFVITVAALATPAAADKGKAPVKPTVKPKVAAPKTDRHWYVSKQGKQCLADQSSDACPPPPAGQPARPCNPPPPTRYTCPKDVPAPFRIVELAGSTDCYVDYGASSCPENAPCNPPPPKKVACP